MMSSDTPPSGEARLKVRRMRLIRYVMLALILGFGLGMGTGAVGRMVSDGVIPALALAGLWAIVLAGSIWFSRDYFRRIDELDLMDNLWASTVALYAFFGAAVSWFVFHDAGLAPSPSYEMLGLFTFTILLIAYGARKMGWR